MSHHILILLLGSVLGTSLFSSCQPLPDPNENQFGANRSPIEIAPRVGDNGAELFATNPLVEFQTTGANPAPIRTLIAGDTLTILRSDGRFTEVRLMDGTVGYVNSSDIIQGSSGYTGGYNNPRQPDQYGNRFGGGTRPPEVIPPNNFPPRQPNDPIVPPRQDPDMIDLDTF